MRCDRVRTPEEARALARDAADRSEAVGEIIAAVRARGDAAVRELTERFDRVAPVEAEPPAEGLEPGLREALELAAANVRAVAEAGVGEERDVALPQGQTVRLREEPVRAAGIYVPGGLHPYPSSVVMGVVTARVAGVEDVAVASPPGPDGRVHPVVAGAAALTGASRVHAMGGAQAVAALAYGTETVVPVDVIAGPGNAWVTEAKRQVFGHVGIDGLAGPSDVLVVAGGDADPAEVALDLLAQAEHGSGTVVAAISPDARLLAEVEERLAEAEDTGAVAALAEVADLDSALAWSEGFAPEHLELLGDEAEGLAPRVRAAGCLFVGTGAAFGDYVAGSNHTLPTQGAARWASGLSPRVFRRRFAEVRFPPAAAAALGSPGAAIARVEGFELHAASMEARMSGR